jgi:hypothetical protein
VQWISWPHVALVGHLCATQASPANDSGPLAVQEFCPNFTRYISFRTNTYRNNFYVLPNSFGLSATSQQFLSKQTSYQYFSLRINQHQAPAKRTDFSSGCQGQGPGPRLIQSMRACVSNPYGSRVIDDRQ